MRSATPKVLHPLCGRPMVLHVVDALAELPLERIVVVVGHGAERVTKTLQEQLVDRGPGRVRRAARATRHRRRGERRRSPPSTTISTPKTTSSCCPGDTPLAAAETIADLATEHRVAGRRRDRAHRRARRRRPATAAWSATRTAASHASSSTPTRTVEEREIDEINTSIYCFRRAFLAPALRRLSPENAQGEYYLTDVVEVLRQRRSHRDGASQPTIRPRRSGSTTACSSPTPKPSPAPRVSNAGCATASRWSTPRAPTSTRPSSSSPTCASFPARSSRGARSSAPVRSSAPTAASSTSSSVRARLLANSVARESEIGDDARSARSPSAAGHAPRRRRARSARSSR